MLYASLKYFDFIREILQDLEGITSKKYFPVIRQEYQVPVGLILSLMKFN